jgi:hypothetical protein
MPGVSCKIPDMLLFIGDWRSNLSELIAGDTVPLNKRTD